MSRANYSDDLEQGVLAMWRGAVRSAINGRRGQAFLKEMLAALDALPQKRLISDALECGGEVCAIGSVGKARGIDMSRLDPEYSEQIAHTFGIADALTREIEYINDEAEWKAETPEERFVRVRAWVVSKIRA